MSSECLEDGYTEEQCLEDGYTGETAPPGVETNECMQDGYTAEQCAIDGYPAEPNTTTPSQPIHECNEDGECVGLEPEAPAVRIIEATPEPTIEPAAIVEVAPQAPAPMTELPATGTSSLLAVVAIGCVVLGQSARRLARRQ